MFYCDACADKFGYPKTPLRKSAGRCECCERHATCNDTPSRFLPPPKSAKPEQTDEQFIATLAQKAEFLAILLRDPQPGTATWVKSVSENAQFIADWWAGKMAKEKP